MTMGILAGSLMKVIVPLTRNVLPPLATMALTSAIDGATQRKMLGLKAIAANGASIEIAGNGVNLVISNQNMDHIIRIIKSLENSSVSIDGVGKTVKHEIEKARLCVS